MPNFKTHKYINYILLILISIFLYYLYQLNHLYLFFIVGYYIGTNYITPDLDINSKPSNHKIWYLYKKISHHRGKTHSLFYGFLFPLIYLLFIIVGIIYIIGITTKDDNLFVNSIKTLTLFINIYYIYIIIFIAGIGTANGIHILIDKITGKW